ncbi:MAG: hypothetical protein QOE60_631 [Thermoleophilaceae bacterium]|jgi:hypothetical protein|nr:hypothetical protein [Thermoleophilaceae bacterium]
MRNMACALCGCLAVLLGACADNGADTVTVERQVTVETVPNPPKKHRRKHRQVASVAPAFVSCDRNIQAKATTTTCPFAENAFWSYWTSGQSSSPISVWSHAAHASFDTTCDGNGSQIVCRTSDGGEVRFSQAALDSYSQAQADAYAGAHDLGPGPGSTGDSGGDGGGDDCQGYDPCIPPGDDVDCGGGSGDGPRYVDGPVSVSGSDPYGLDSDGDGVGCQS